MTDNRLEEMADEDTKKQNGSEGPDSIPPDEKAAIMVELSCMRTGIEEVAALGARAVRLSTELKPMVEALTNEVLDQKAQLKKLASKLALNRGVDDTQNRKIAEIEGKLSTKEKAQLGGGLAGILMVIEGLRAAGVFEWLKALAKGSGGG